MSSVNKVILVGNLCRDPEVRNTSNSIVANLNIATNEKYKDQNKTEYHKVVVWGKPAEFAEKYLHKGDSVYVEGKLETRKWQDKDGNDKYTTEIVVGVFGNLQSLGGRSTSGNTTETPPAQPESNNDPFGESIPF